MHVKALIARAHAYHGAWALMTDVPHRRLAIASARVAATESYRFAARESVQLHGAMGTSWEHDAHLHLRRAETLGLRSEEHTSELQSLMRSSYAVFCLKQKTSNKIRS